MGRSCHGAGRGAEARQGAADAGQAVTEDRPLELAIHLAEVRAAFDKKDESWRFALLIALKRFLQAAGLDRELLDPLQQLIFEQAGRKGEHAEAAVMTVAAAAVTVLKHRGEFASIKDALASVACSSGLNEKQLRIFRNNLSSRQNLRADIVPSAIVTAGGRNVSPSTKRTLRAPKIPTTVSVLKLPLHALVNE